MKGIIQQIKNRINIVDIISQKVKLQKKGANYFGICPFHNEKSSSFSVNENKQIFHCFGCGKSGDVFEFLIKHDNITFKESLEILANIAGVEIPKNQTYDPLENNIQLKKIDLLTKINDALKDIFHNNLFLDIGKSAREYLTKRKIKEDSWRKFSIGFSSYTTLEYQKLLDLGFSSENINDSQNFLNSKNSRFFGRIIFPIENIKNNCVGFGGRIITDDKNVAKYINSPESLIFKKREIFFGENKINRSSGNLIITEGYLDVISMVDNGFENTVAPLGTAISEDHVRKALKFAKTPIIAFDGDKAGLNAMYSAIDKILPILNEDGKSFNFVILPNGYDLDGMIHENIHSLKQLLQEPLLMVDMIVKKLTSEIIINSPESKIEMINAIRKKVDLLNPPLLQKFYLNALKDKIFINDEKKRTIYKKEINKPLLKKIDVNIQIDFLFAVVILFPEILKEVGEQFLNLDCYQEMKTEILNEYSIDNFVSGKILLANLKKCGYNDTIGKIFEKNIHVKYLSEADNTENLIEIWLNVYYKIIRDDDFIVKNSVNSKLKKWKSLNLFKKKIDQE